MHFSPFLAIALIWLACSNFSLAQTVSISEPTFTLHCVPEDSSLLLSRLANGARAVEQFFGHPFPRQFDVYVFPNRAALDIQWQQDWGDSTFQSSCWMVASGVAHRFDILSPRAWQEEACEHKMGDTVALSKLLQHELVHVFHGQHNPKPDFAGMDEMGWWIEGIAVYASGQLDEARLAGVRELINKDAAPQVLSKFWSGKHKYGLAGSVAAWLDKANGRATLFQLLACTDTNQALKTLQADEAATLAAWRKYWLENK